MPRCVPEGKFDAFAGGLVLNLRNVVLEDRRYVFLAISSASISMILVVDSRLTSGKYPCEYEINRQVFPHPPSPTTTNFLLYSGGTVTLVVALPEVALVFTVPEEEPSLPRVERR